jgi:wobble nucleotide-excising tRNase
MLPPRLSYFNSIKNCGIIRSHVNEKSTPTFRRYNIIFGFNGRGKTTLSRIFRSLEQGALDRSLPPGSQFSVTLNDASTIESDENIDLIRDQIKVFNSDFVTENLRWSEATADPVFYIGPEAAKRSRLFGFFTRYVVTDIKIIEKHNEYQEEFELRKRKAIKAVKFSIIRASFDDLKKLEEACDDSKKAFDTRDRLASKLKAVIISLEAAVRHHGPAVPEINRLLAEYLGHSEISLASLEVGYEIRRSGVRLDGPLSEGERTAIALCYFVCKIKENGRGVNDFIIVVDDPVSSMDFSSLYYAYCMIKLQLFESRQIIIMTHNIDFLNEAKRWMRSENDKIERSNKKNKEDAEVPAEFFSLFVKEDKLEQWRASSIGRMPKALRVYGSEYHYLFSVLMDFHGANGEISNGSEFMVPHIIRRALELFLAFKIPGSDGLEAKLQHDVIKKSRVSVERLMALLRISHSGSHSDNVDGIVKLKPISSEEMLKATKALFDLMKALDELHFERLLKVCKESSA